MRYKKWGKISAALFPCLFAVLIIVSFFTLSAVVYAAEISYTGDGKKLQESPRWSLEWFPRAVSSWLFPGTQSAPLSSGNKVTVNYDPATEGTIIPKLIAGGVSETGNVSGNRVMLPKGKGYVVFGGLSCVGKVTGNTVSLGGGFVMEKNVTTGGWLEEGKIYGGWSDRGKVTDNTVTISGGKVEGDVIGGCSGDDDVSGNKIVISGDSFTGLVCGGMSERGDVAGNTVTISGVEVRGGVYGGESYSGSVTRNRIVIGGGTVGGDVSGGVCGGGNATGNTLTVSGVDVRGGVYGGGSDIGSATGNAVIVRGGSLGENMYGGYSENGDATGNTVTISGKPNLAKTSIFGGHTENAAKNAFTGNVLNFKSSGVSVKSIGNFEYYHFYLPEDLAAGGAMLSVAEPADLKGAIVAIILQDNAQLRKGDKVALIYSAAGIRSAPKNIDCQVQQGGKLYEFSIHTERNNLWAEVAKISKAAK